jgi:hypothetical protein
MSNIEIGSGSPRDLAILRGRFRGRFSNIILNPQQGVDRAEADAELLGDGTKRGPLLTEGTGLVHIYNSSWSTKTGTPPTSCCYSGLGPLPDQLAFEFGDGSNDVEREPTGRGRGVDAVLHGDEIHPHGPEGVEGIDEVPDASGKSSSPLVPVDGVW